MDIYMTLSESKYVSNNLSMGKCLCLILLSSHIMGIKIFMIRDRDSNANHLNICISSTSEYQGEINLKNVNKLKGCQKLAAAHFGVFVDAEVAGGAVAGGAIEFHWWIICLFTCEWHSGVWIKGLLSCFSIRKGCQERHHSEGLLFRQHAQKSCHCSSTTDQRPGSMSGSVIIFIWHAQGNYLSWRLISWRFKCLNCCG